MMIFVSSLGNLLKDVYVILKRGDNNFSERAQNMLIFGYRYSIP